MGAAGRAAGRAAGGVPGLLHHPPSTQPPRGGLFKGSLSCFFSEEVAGKGGDSQADLRAAGCFVYRSTYNRLKPL